MKTPPRVTRWVLSPHALQRVLERKISVDELEAVIRSPGSAIPQGPKWIFTKKLSGRTDNLVAAVLLKRSEQKLWVVLTVMVRFEAK